MSNITRRDPLDDFFRGFFVRPVEYGGGPAANAEAPQMRVDVKEQEDAYQVHAELPGIKKEDIHVHIDGPVVSISAMSAWCIGDIDELEALLPPESGLLTHIGKRARIGHGRIRSIRIEHAEEATDKWRLRVLPWQESPNYLPIQAAFRPPYWAAENRGMAFVPTEL